MAVWVGRTGKSFQFCKKIAGNPTPGIWEVSSLALDGRASARDSAFSTSHVNTLVGHVGAHRTLAGSSRVHGSSKMVCRSLPERGKNGQMWHGDKQ